VLFKQIGFWILLVLSGKAVSANPNYLNHKSIREEATSEELEAAQGIESLMVDLLIQEMRKTVPENDIIPVSQGEKIFRSMLDSEYAKTISQSGTLGITDLVLEQMKGKR